MPQFSRAGVLAGMVCLVFGSASLPGCKATTAEGTPARYNGLSGDLHADLNAPIDRVYAASKAAMDELEFRVTDQSKDALQGYITALQANGDKITITMTRKADEVTRIDINIGPLGKESVARAVIDAVESHL